MKISICLITFLSFAISSNAIRCWVCDNVKSNDECLRKGRNMACQHNQGACETHIRKRKSSILITKSCKQGRACGNNQIQNPRPAWISRQCNLPTPKDAPSVCRCCCFSNLCNRDNTNCMPDLPTVNRPADEEADFCFPLEPPLNGKKECYLGAMPFPEGNPVTLRTDCIFSCDEGYRMRGPSRSTCIRNEVTQVAEFDNPPPFCTPNRCFTEQTAPENGEISCTNGRNILSVCTFTCDEGFVVIGMKSLICTSSRYWSNNPPTCEKPTCSPAHENPKNGLVTCSNGNVVFSVCRFVCNEGFYLEGDSNSECIEDEESESYVSWSSPAPVCNPIKCTKQTAPVNGAVECTRNRALGSVCTFECNDKTELIGNNRTVCLDDTDEDNVGEWSNLPPTCRDLICATLRAPKNGRIACSDNFNVDSRCSFQCNNGFYRNGSASTLCRRDSLSPTLTSWTNEVPECIRIRCLRQLAPPNGNVNCSNFRNLGSLCTFNCRQGYYIVGSSTTRCIDDNDNDAEGAWSRPRPTCQEITCANLEPPINGEINCDNGNRYGSVCTSTCNAGYFPSGSSLTSVCQEDLRSPSRGSWSDEVPQCIRITCPRQRNLRNGEVSCSQMNNLDSVCRFSCNEGYLLEGNDVSTCVDDDIFDANAQWNNPRPTCNDIFCTELDAPANGGIDCSDDNRYASVCSFTCNDGFFLSGASSTTCQENSLSPTRGSWSEDVPRCIRIRCSRQEAPINGRVTCSNRNRLGSVCTFDCDIGHVLEGNEITTCVEDGVTDANGRWNNPLPVCAEIVCMELNPSRNGRINCNNGNRYASVCNFACNDGYAIRSGSPSSATCQEDRQSPTRGSWSNAVPPCDPIQCSVQQPPRNGGVSCSNRNNLGSVCTFTCEDGYNLDGNVLVTCIDDDVVDNVGIWDNAPPVCNVGTCLDLFAPDNGTIRCSDGFNVGSRCFFECNDKFYLNGMDSTRCRIDESSTSGVAWRNDVPLCIPIRCQVQTPPNNGDVNCNDDENLGSLCMFTCNNGYFLVGSETALCIDDNDNDADGIWSTEAPVCQEIVCSNLNPPRNGQIDCNNGNRFGSVCSFICNDGYFLSGSSTAVCQEDLQSLTRGSWSNNVPRCIPIRCPVQNAPNNGGVSCTNRNNLQSACTFTCLDGYELQGNDITTCLDDNVVDTNGQWDNAPPVCSEITCRILRAPINGEIICDNANKFASTCSFDCDDGYFLEGSSSTLCTKNLFSPSLGSWNNAVPQCIRVRCVNQDAPLNGAVRCSNGAILDSICSFSCNNGYRLVGSSTATCIDDNDNDTMGIWNQRTPICQKIICNVLSAPLNGNIDCSDDNNYNSTCDFECNQGFLRIGSPSSLCEENSASNTFGSWSNPVPRCNRIRCLSQAAPTNGGVSCTDNRNLDSVCSFTCDVGFYLRGSEQNLCIDDNDGDTLGEWTFPTPSCIDINCRNFTRFPNGKFNCSDELNFASMCNFECNPGYFLDGHESAECIEDVSNRAVGRWNNDIPPDCKRIRCVEQEAPDNGQVECTDEENLDSTCTFTCNSGYELAGSRTTTCFDDNNGDAIGLWTNERPTCEALICPDLSSPDNGAVQCSDVNRLASNCIFSCIDGYFLSGSTETECAEDSQSSTGASWTQPTPLCLRIRCLEQVAPVNGAVNCSNAENPDSVCTFTCNEGYQLSGNEETTCFDDLNGDERALWTNPAPVCEEIVCPVLNNLLNGNIDCSEENRYDSICAFQCNDGFFLDGANSAVCLENPQSSTGGSWSNALPRCRPVTCIEQIAPRNGAVNCDNGVSVDSTCQFTCNDGYFLNGSITTECFDDQDGDDVGEWIFPPPFCEPIICVVQQPPANGAVDCTQANNLGSRCLFTCNAGFRMNGRPTIVCQDDNENDSDGEWNRPAPTCEEIRCLPSQENLKNGEVLCSDSNRINSTCNYECQTGGGFTLFPETSQTTQCLVNGSWDKQPPCCALSCPPFAIMDMLIVLDSSSSIGDANWETMTGFISEFISQFQISPEYAHIGVFRYNREVDKQSEIFLNSFPDNKTALLEAFERIPYNGRGTNTGLALREANNAFRRRNGNRPNVQDILIVITDGAAQDEELLNLQASRLRRRNILTYAVGIVPPRGRLNREQLQVIAGDESRVLVAEGGFEGLRTVLNDQLREQICENRCS